jgi:hypothetical protein
MIIDSGKEVYWSLESKHMQLKTVIPNPFGSTEVLSVSSFTLPCLLPEQVIIGIESRTLVVEEQSSGRLASSKSIDRHLNASLSRFNRVLNAT